MNKETLLKGLRNFLWGEDTGVEVNDFPDNDPEGVEVEKAANPMHSHSHAHLSSYGYSYSHEHDHTHRDGVTPNSDNHDSSETAHAHVHVSKAGDTVSPEMDGLLADIKGLAEKLGQLTAQHEAAQKENDDLKGQLAEVSKAKDEAAAKVADAEKVKTEAVEKAVALEAQLKEAGREPKVAAPVVEKAVAKVDGKMKFDEAFDAVLGRTTPLPKA